MQPLLINAMNQNQRSPIMLALMNRSYAVFDILLKVDGVDLLFQDNLERTMLHYAVLLKRLDIMEMLISKGVSVQAKEYHGLTARDYAVYTQWTEGVEFFSSLKDE